MLIDIVRNGDEISPDAWNTLIEEDSTLSGEELPGIIHPRTGETVRPAAPAYIYWKPDGETICGLFTFSRGKISFESREEEIAEQKAREIAEKLNAEIIVFEEG